MPAPPPSDSHAVERRREIPSAIHSQRRSQLRGLLLLALAAIAFAIMRAGLHRAFNPGWWRLW